MPVAVIAELEKSHFQIFKSNIMKSLIFVAMATMLHLLPVGKAPELSLSISNHTSTIIHSLQNSQTSGYSIVIQDSIILLTDTNDEKEHIEQIDIYISGSSTPVKTIEGCYASSCSHNLSELATGPYSVVVQTDLGSTFSGNVFVGS